jgi:surface polysaccharide O-acyltransferase-like enzyme
MKLLQKIGRTSIGIYLMSGILFYFCIKEQLRIDDSYRYLIKSAYVLGLSVVLTALCYMVSRLLAKNKTTGKLFMGHV